MVREISPGIGGGEEEREMNFYEEREEAYYRPPTPIIAPAPAPSIIPIIPRGEPPYNIPIVRRPPTPTGPGERGEGVFQRLPFEAFAPLQPLNIANIPTAPYIEREQQIREQAANILGNTLRSVFSGVAPPPQDIYEASLIFAGKQRDLSKQWSFDWRGMLENYKRIFKKYYEGPTFDFAITGPEAEMAYSPEEYTPTYEYDIPTYTISYGGGGTPSSRRDYSSNLINWRV